MELDLSTATPATTPEVTTEVTPVVDVKTDQPHADAVDAGAKKDDEVSLAAWARTNKAARESKDRVGELEKQIVDLDAKLKATPVTDDEAKFLERLKQPGAAKALIKAGRTFEDVVAELTDIEVDDPKHTETITRLSKLEKELTDKTEAEKKAKADNESAAMQRAEKAASDRMMTYAKESPEIVDNEKDIRNGTPRWAIVSERQELIDQARSGIADYIRAKHPGGVTDEQAESLVQQALDQVELAERAKLAPIMNKLGVKRPVNRTPDKSSRVTADTDPFGNGRRSADKPKTIMSDMKGPAPIRTKPTRYSGGPRQITYTD